VVGSKFVLEVEDAVGVGFRGVEVIVGTFERGEVFNREVFWELFDREAGKIIGHSIESWGFTCRVFISVWGDAD